MIIMKLETDNSSDWLLNLQEPAILSSPLFLRVYEQASLSRACHAELRDSWAEQLAADDVYRQS